MARGVRERLALDGRPADVGLATTGVAGPEPQDGHPVGTVWIAVIAIGRRGAHACSSCGDRAAIREATVEAALGLARGAARSRVTSAAGISQFRSRYMW